MIFAVSWATWVLLCLVLAVITFIFFTDDSKDKKTQAPGPRQWPIIGNIPFIAKYETTVEAFMAMGREYGDIATLKLGTVNSMVVSGLDNIREVLVTRSQYFDSRPGFQRFDMLFEGNRNNSLAFADWSENQKKRREIIGHHAFPKKASPRFDVFEKIATTHISEVVETLKSSVAEKGTDSPHFLKQHFAEGTLKIFLQYFCGLEINDENREEFLHVVKVFDDIFTEMNASCIGDIFPQVMPICGKSGLKTIGEPIREFTLKHCVHPYKASLAAEKLDENNNNIEGNEQVQLNLMQESLNNVGKDISEDSVLFALEDMIGGHSAISNLLTTLFMFLGQNPEVQEKIREETAQHTEESPITLTENNLSYTEAVVWETTRHISSLLVPHVANQDTHLGDYPVKKGTVIFMNNGELNTSTKYWTEPEKFDPERFLKGGQVLKPDHFIPFGTGRRSCLGFKLLLFTSSLFISNICSSFEIGLLENENHKWTLGSLAVPGEGFKFTLKPIQH